MHPADLAPFAILMIPAVSLAGIVASATVSDTAQRWIFGVLGWIGWLASVGFAAFVGLLVVGFSCWADSTHGTTCGEDAFGAIVIVALIAAALPALAYLFRLRQNPLPNPHSASTR